MCFAIHDPIKPIKEFSNADMASIKCFSLDIEEFYKYPKIGITISSARMNSNILLYAK